MTSQRAAVREARKDNSSRRHAAENGSTKVRYAVVGIGWIAQEAVLPAFQNAPNSELLALVTGDPAKAQEVGRKYQLKKTVSYDEYDNLLASGEIDAVYIALPNQQHREFAVRALRAGVHVLCESLWRKPNCNAWK